MPPRALTVQGSFVHYERPLLAQRELHRLARVHPTLTLTTTEVANLLGLAPDTIRSWAHRGHLPRANDSKPHRPRYRISDILDIATRLYR